MKTLSKILTIALFSLASLTSVSAYAAGKIGYVNTGQLMQELPQVKALKQKLDTEGAGERAELDRMKKDLTAKVEKLNSQAASLSKEQIAKQTAEIRDMQINLEKKAQPFNQKMAQMEHDEMKAINEKIQNAIDSVAKSGGYDIILNGQALAYAKEGTDITQAVLDKLK